MKCIDTLTKKVYTLDGVYTEGVYLFDPNGTRVFVHVDTFTRVVAGKRRFQWL